MKDLVIEQQERYLCESGYYDSVAHDQRLIEEYEVERDGRLQLQDTLEDRDMANSRSMTPPLPPVEIVDAKYPNFSDVSIKKRHHSDLILEDVCSRCAHCGLELTDALSIETGMGPICRGKGYLEDPKESDEMQAMIDLAEYPELIEFLMTNYKPKGVRGLMNGLVKVASLNRKHEVFGACCDAIDSLGYKALASVLRDSLAAIIVSKNKQYPDYYVVWVKRVHWNLAWSRQLYQITGTRSRVYGVRGALVPKTQKKALWRALLEVYQGYVVKTAHGSYKIKTGPKQKVA